MASFLLASLATLVFLGCCHAEFIADIYAQILRSDSCETDLDTLSQITIRKAKVAVKDTATAAKSIIDLNNTSYTPIIKWNKYQNNNYDLPTTT